MLAQKHSANHEHCRGKPENSISPIYSFDPSMPRPSKSTGAANQAGVKILVFQPNNPVVNDRLSRSNLFLKRYGPKRFPPRSPKQCLRTTPLPHAPLTNPGGTSSAKARKASECVSVAILPKKRIDSQGRLWRQTGRAAFPTTRSNPPQRLRGRRENHNSTKSTCSVGLAKQEKPPKSGAFPQLRFEPSIVSQRLSAVQ